MKRIVQLDGLRFLAVFFIFIAHWVQGHVSAPIIKEIPFVHGVIFFFVLSGFLITKSLLVNANKNKRTVIKTFYARRFLRIFPVFYILIIILFIINFEQTRQLIVWLITYTINIYQSIHNADIQHLNHLWSLAVEEQFYIFWPFLILFVKQKHIIKLIVAIIIFSILVKAYLFFFVGNWRATAYFTLSNLYALGLGGLLASFTLFKPKIIQLISNNKIILLALSSYVLIVIFKINSNYPWYKEIFDEFLFSIISLLIINKTSNSGFKGFFSRFLENKFVIYLGKISYGLYLFHLLVPPLIEYLDLKVNSKPLLLIIYFTTTFILAHFSWIFIEKPINRLKNKFKY